MHVDSFFPLVMGREVYGLPKSLAEITMPDSPGESEAFSVSTEVLPTLGSNSRTERLAIMNVRSRGAGFTALGSKFTYQGEAMNAKSFFEAASQHYTEESDLSEATGDWDTDDLQESFDLLKLLVSPGIFLKQLPVATGSDGADFQQLIEASFVPKVMIPDFRFLIGYEGIFEDHASYPLASLLGLPAGTAVEAILSFWTSIDFVAEPGKPADLGS